MADTTLCPAVGDEVPDRRRSHRKPSHPAEINMTPLIDVLFMLMLFFLLGTRFLKSEGVIPKPNGIGGPPLAPIRIAISEPAPGQPVVTVDRRASSMKSLYTDLSAIAAAFGQTDQVVVELAPEKGVPWRHVLQVYNEVKRAGFTHVGWPAR
ncbi:MAG: biopolymer transporter ExbD [Phycisphaerae bacterium]|nr:biopolymer transporter ExbD [Phycisphaerae bacterium]